MSITDTFLLRPGDPLWEQTIAFAQSCSWRAGPVLAKRMRENAFQPWERVIAAAEDGTVIGYCTLTEKDDSAEEGYAPFIGFVFVDEAHRGRRISQRMIETALRYAKGLGYGTVYLISDERGLYEKYGFTKLGDCETVFGTREQLFCRGV